MKKQQVLSQFFINHLLIIENFQFNESFLKKPLDINQSGCIRGITMIFRAEQSLFYQKQLKEYSKNLYASSDLQNTIRFIFQHENGCPVPYYQIKPADQNMSIFNLFKRVQQPADQSQKPDLDSTFFNMKVKQLPSNFAQSVMDLQMKLQFSETYNMEVVQQLNDLYRLAVQFYIHQDPKKANHFQRKLTSLFSNPQTLSLFDKTKQQPKQQSYQKHLHSQIGLFNSQSTALVAQMIESSQRKIQKTGRILDQQIRDQQSKLNSRLEHRSRSRQTKTKRPFLSP